MIRQSSSGKPKRARGIALLALIVILCHGAAVDASAQDRAKVSTNCTTAVNRTDPNDSNPSARGGCIPDTRCCLGTNNDGVGKSPDGSKPSPETATVLAIAKSTLEGVHESTDFLATLWKWTTIGAGLLVAVLAIFGVSTIWDLKKVADQANQAGTQMQTQFDGFANYKLGKMSKALEMVKKSLDFKGKKCDRPVQRGMLCSEAAITRRKS